MSRWLAAWRSLWPIERLTYAGHVAALEKIGWNLTDDQREYVIESVKAGKKPEIARLSQLASTPDDAA